MVIPCFPDPASCGNSLDTWTNLVWCGSCWFLLLRFCASGSEVGLGGISIGHEAVLPWGRKPNSMLEYSRSVTQKIDL